MGEISEMMLDGTLCQVCGSVIDGDTPGYPRYCLDCAKDEVVSDIEEIEYDFNFNKVAIEKLVEQIIECGTKKQKKTIINTLYKCIGKVKR